LDSERLDTVTREPGNRLRRGDWVALIDGVRINRTWLTRHTPRLLAAWRDTPSPEERRTVALCILQTASQQAIDSHAARKPASPVAWEGLAERIDARLLLEPDWPPLTAALDRAAAAGYDVTRRLPALAAAAPLPARHRARELHWRLLEDCPAALPTHRARNVQTTAGERRPEVHTASGSPQVVDPSAPNQSDSEASTRAGFTSERNLPCPSYRSSTR
jgi:hypothetical protein